MTNKKRGETGTFSMVSAYLFEKATLNYYGIGLITNHIFNSAKNKNLKKQGRVKANEIL